MAETPSALPASVAAASGGVLARFFPAEDGRLREMVEQAGLARVYQGIHCRHDVEASWEIVRQILEMGIERDRTNDT